MKTIGLLGGMSWESTLPYYRIINEAVAARLGGLHSAKIVLDSVDFHEIAHLQHTGCWTEAGEILAGRARALQAAGADFLVLCTNTMHKVAPQIEAAVDLPLLHIADTTAARIMPAGVRRLGLLATRFTMEDEFYRGRLRERHALDVFAPGAEDRETVHRIIYDELCGGKVLDDSRERCQAIVRRLVGEGAEAVIFGCTEIMLLLGPDDVDVPVFDTTRIHAEEAARLACAS